MAMNTYLTHLITATQYVWVENGTRSITVGDKRVNQTELLVSMLNNFNLFNLQEAHERDGARLTCTSAVVTRS